MTKIIIIGFKHFQSGDVGIAVTSETSLSRVRLFHQPYCDRNNVVIIFLVSR